MKKLFKFAALGGVAFAVRKLAASRKPDATEVDLRQPQKTVEKVEAAVGEPVRP